MVYWTILYTKLSKTPYSKSQLSEKQELHQQICGFLRVTPGTLPTDMFCLDVNSPCKPETWDRDIY